MIRHFLAQDNLWHSVYDSTNLTYAQSQKIIRAIIMNLIKHSLALAACLASFSFSAFSHAAEPTDTDKLNFIQEQFQQGKDYSQLWQYGWLSVFSTSATVNGVLWSESSSRKEKFASKVGFITSSLGVGDMLVTPMPTHTYAKKLQHEKIELAEAERWLMDAMEKERYQRSFTSHFLSGLVAAASGVAIAKNDHHKNSDGLLTFATNFLASEVKIWTSPTQMTRAWNAYQNGNLELAQQRPSTKQWHLAAAGPVLYFQYQF